MGLEGAEEGRQVGSRVLSVAGLEVGTLNGSEVGTLNGVGPSVSIVGADVGLGFQVGV